MNLPRSLGAAQSEAERARWRVVRLDSCVPLDGAILHADVDTGVAVMRVRGPDGLAGDGSIVPTWQQATYNLGPGGLAIVAR
jgi:hypothetical protein